MSWQTTAEIIFKNCEPSVCESLYLKVTEGIPVFASQINTGDSFKLEKEEITSIEQIGSNFKIGVATKTNGSNIFHHVSFKCFKSIPCLFISTRGISSVRLN
jgi:hypothetical protein